MRSLLERQRVANESIGTVDVVAVAVDGTDANAQVFQIRDGVLSDRQSFYLENAVERDVGEVAEEFLLQYYGDQMAIPPQVIVQEDVPDRDALSEALGQRRGAKVEVRAAERGDKRRILELAERNALLALDQERLKAERRRQQRVEALDGLQDALGLDALPLRIECFDISNLMGTHTVASMVVFEGGAPKKSDYRRFNVRGLQEGVPDDFAAMEEVLGRRLAQWETQQDLSPHDPERNESFATLPNLVVIDGGQGQLAAGVRALDGFRKRGVAVISLAKRIEEVFVPGRREPIVLPHDTPELQLLQRVRDEAHRFAITHHRTRRDRAMTTSILDDLPGIGPARKRTLWRTSARPRRCSRPRASSSRWCRACRARPRATSGRTCTAPATDSATIHSGLTAMSDEPERLQDMGDANPARRRAARACVWGAAVARSRPWPRRARRGPTPRRALEDLVVITGYSGAGKSTAMNVFEDAGYFCVDNLPPEMIRALVELFVHEGSKVERAAVVSDVRGGDYFEALRAVLEDLRGARAGPSRALPRRRRRRAAHALPGDAPAPPAGAGLERRARHRPGARRARAHQGPGRRGHRLHRA